jgi:hypothetical protein
MGFAANGFCFDTQEAAAQFACGHDYPLAAVGVDSTGAPTSVVIECTSEANGVLFLQRDVNGASVGAESWSPSSPACDVTAWQTYYPFSFSAADGATVGAAVIGAWAVAWGWKAVYMVLRDRFSSSGEEE